MVLPHLRQFVKMSVVPLRKCVFLHHFDICDENGDPTTDIVLLLL